jgi:hypothetical protein
MVLQIRPILKGMGIPPYPFDNFFRLHSHASMPPELENFMCMENKAFIVKNGYAL